MLSFFFSCNSVAQKKESFKIQKTEAEWKLELTELQYYVMREEGTERAFSSPLDKNYSEGIYVCAGCDVPLFHSKNKFNSGSGWPSFDVEIKGNIAYQLYLLLIILSYYLWFWVKHGQTLGMKSWKAYIVTENNQKITISQGLIRILMSLLGGHLLLIFYKN